MSTIAESAAFIGGAALGFESFFLLLAIRLGVRGELPPEAKIAPLQDLFLVLVRLLIMYALVLYGVFFQLEILLGTPLGRALCVCAAILLAIEMTRWHLSTTLRPYNSSLRMAVRAIGAVSFSVAALSPSF